MSYILCRSFNILNRFTRRSLHKATSCNVISYPENCQRGLQCLCLSSYKSIIVLLSLCISAAGLMLFLKQLVWTLIWLAGYSTGETVAAMSRRSRNSRAWRYVWGGIRRDADARALVLASENEEWGYDRLEVSIQELLFFPWPCSS